MKKLIIVFILCTMWLPAWGDPSITTISGTLTNGETITISGSGFGSKSSAGPIISSYDNATSANNFHTGSVGGSWILDNSAVIANATPRTSLYQSDYYINCDYSGSNNRLQYTGSIDQGNYFYVSFWHYITESTFDVPSPSNNSKVWMWYMSTDSLNKVMEEYYDAGSYADNFTGAFDNDGSGHDPGDSWTNGLSYLSYQNWHLIEIYGYSGTAGASGDGWLRTAIDGRWYRNYTGFSPGTHNNNRWFFGQCTGMNESGGSIYVDQVYIDNTVSHVFLSSSNSLSGYFYSNTSSTIHNEIQVCSSWSDSSIAITLNRGTFGATDTAYLYVVDSSGVLSSPYTVELGEAAAVRGALTNGGTLSGTFY